MNAIRFLMLALVVAGCDDSGGRMPDALRVDAGGDMAMGSIPDLASMDMAEPVEDMQRVAPGITCWLKEGPRITDCCFGADCPVNNCAQPARTVGAEFSGSCCEDGDAGVRLRCCTYLVFKSTNDAGPTVIQDCGGD